MEYSENTLRIHYEGWSDKYDEFLSIRSPKIAPFRTHTQGYTGQVKQAYREFVLNDEYHGKMLNKVKEIVLTNFECLSSA